MWRIATDLINLVVGSTVAVKCVQLGVINADTADTWFLSSLTDTYIPRKRNNAFCSGSVSTGTDLAINFDLVKCITKININRYQNYNGKVDGGISPER